MRSSAVVLCMCFWPIALACSCGPPTPICTRIDRVPVLFIGDVLSSNDDGTGTFAQLTLERVRVVEVFKGLAADVKEVWLDPGSGTSCYAHLTPGRRYFIEGTGSGKATADVARYSRNYRGEAKALPPGFDPATSTIVSAMGCSRTAELAPGNADVEFLRAAKAGRWKPRIDGWADQLDQLSAMFQPGLPVAGMAVRLTGTAGFERRATTGQDGGFAFEDLAAGNYRVALEKAGFTGYRRSEGAGGRLRLDLRAGQNEQPHPVESD